MKVAKKQPVQQLNVSKQLSFHEWKEEALLSLIILLIGLVIWEILSRSGIFNPHILPAPSIVIVATWELILSGDFYFHLGETLFGTIAGFLIGTCLAVILGIIVSSNLTLYKVLIPFIVFLHAIPIIALAHAFVTSVGFGSTAKVFMAITICFFPTYLYTVIGLKSVDKQSRLLFQSMVASKKDVFFKLSLPIALPHIFVGVKASLTFALIGAIVGEFVGADKGLGYLLKTFNFQLEMASLFALIVILVVIGFLLYLLIEWLNRKLIFWGNHNQIS